MRKFTEKPLLSLKAQCLICGKPSNEIRLQSFRGGEFGTGRTVAFVACDYCFSDKGKLEEVILAQGLHKLELPGGLERRHIELKA